MGTAEEGLRAAEAGVCPECGSVSVALQDALRARDEVIETQREDIGNLERELRGKRAQIARMRGEQDRSVREEPHYATAMEVLLYWRQRCAPRTRELRGKRLDNCIARLRAGHSPETLRRAVDGYAARPYVVNGRRTDRGHKDDWRADAELIFREVRYVDQGLRIAEREEDYRHAMALGGAPSADEGPGATALGRLGEAATHYARRGIHVFPVLPNQKAPACPRGLLEATVDIDRIQRFWETHGDCNVGLRCGAVSGLVVLDVDDDKGGVEALRKLEQEYGELPTTASVKTPRGGSHYYFRHPGVEILNTQGFPGPGLDVRGDGGYVLAVPSRVDGRPYSADEQAPIAPLPTWLLTLLVQRQGREGQAKPAEHWGAVVARGAREGERNGLLASYVGHLLSLGMAEPELRATVGLWNQANVRPPLDAREVTRTVDSVLRTRQRSKG